MLKLSQLITLKWLLSVPEKGRISLSHFKAKARKFTLSEKGMSKAMINLSTVSQQVHAKK